MIQKPLGPSTMLMPEEVVHALGCHDNNTPEAVTKHGSCTKLQNADRPKRYVTCLVCLHQLLIVLSAAYSSSFNNLSRRLLPVSSILLKDIGNIDFKDENEKPKVNSWCLSFSVFVAATVVIAFLFLLLTIICIQF